MCCENVTFANVCRLIYTLGIEVCDTTGEDLLKLRENGAGEGVGVVDEFTIMLTLANDTYVFIKCLSSAEKGFSES